METVDSYINGFEGKTKDYLQQLRLLIREIVPDTTERINYNIAAFTLIAGGKREAQIMIAGYKEHIGFYPHPATMEKFWDELDGYKKAKGSVQFPLSKPLPIALIVAMVKYRKELVEKERDKK